MITRTNFATTVANEALKNPELALEFIGLIADECSKVELIRIQQKFLKSVKTIHSKRSLEN